MENKERSAGWETFKIWFGIGALMFGTYCGANMASGVYATTYITTLGGGWMWVFLGIFILFMSVCCILSLNVIRCYKVDNYNSYYLTLYGLQKPESNKTLKAFVTVFFDVYTLLMGVVTTAATIALFASLMKTLLNVPILIGSLIAVVMFAVLTVYGAGFLRKFNGVMTIFLAICLTIILVAVISVRGGELSRRICDFTVQESWTGTTLSAHMGMFLSYCCISTSWGGTLSNYSDRIHTKKDAVGSGILIGLMVASLFLMTSLIVLPFLPDVFTSTPILDICRGYFPGILTLIYWIVVIFSVVSTGPTFIFNVSNRFSKVWKTEKISQKMKFFILGMGFLILCLLISGVGLIAICQKGYTLLGKIAIPTIGIPLIISVFRVAKKDKEAVEEKAK